MDVEDVKLPVWGPPISQASTRAQHSPGLLALSAADSASLGIPLTWPRAQSPLALLVASRFVMVGICP